MYDIPLIDLSVRCAFTNTVLTAPYRGAGRPEANYVLERLVEEAARVTGIDPVKLRRRNLIRPAAMPYTTAVGTTYDSGDFAPMLDRALQLADYKGFKSRRRAAKSRGRYRGIGISCMLEHAGGTPTEGALLTFPGDGTLTVNLNVQSTGQGHATVFLPLVAERLGIARDKLTHRHGDSAMEIAGYASVGSRSAMTAGASIVKCIEVMLEKGKRVAAMALEASEGDIGYAGGNFEVVGTDRRLSLFDAAAEAADFKRRGLLEEDLDTKVTTETPLTFPNGVHIAEVEVDPDTGRMQIVNYAAVDDCGVALDQRIVEGQLHGSLAQGRWGDERHRQVRGLADRSPGVAHGGGDTLYPLLAPTCAAPTTSAGAGGDSILAEMMELGRWGDERHRQVRGLADRSPGVAHGGGDTLYPLLAPTCAAPTTSAGAGGDSILAEMMELGRWGDERHRQVRGLADRSPGVAHGGGDTLYPLLAPTCAAPTTSAGAGGDSILAEMMELGRWGDERHRQVRGLADRSPGVAHGGGDTLYPLLAPTCAAPTTSAGAGGDSILAEMMELGRWGDERHRQVRGLADRSPGVAHGGGDTLYPLLAPTCAAPTTSAGAGGDSILAEMMELGRWGDERHRQVRGLADRSPGVAHGGGDTLYPLLAPTCAAPNEVKQGDC